jgi:alkylation response protein AidB-like acyl-CoA dehydrogenase/acyl-CoA synthetase (AMP-forming)/AMP-acid ligase II/acyl carrier protein
VNSDIPDDRWPLTIPEAVLRNLERRPDSPAFVFLDSDGEPKEQLTYRELDEAARRFAAKLVAAGLTGKNAAMLFGAGPAFIVSLLGCAYARVVGIPLQVPRTAAALARVGGICGDAGTTTVLGPQDIHRDLLERFGGAPELADLRWVDAGGDGETGADMVGWADIEADPDALAMLQYTSGSTGNPKGVMISHRHFAVQAAEIDALWPCDRDSAVVSWLPTFHDMGLLFGVILPLWAGIPVYLMSPQQFIRRPRSWLEAISRFRGTHAASPDFGYELCVRRIPEDERQGLDLSSWRAAVNGAERVRWQTLRRFTEAFAPHGLRPHTVCPAYGLAENTLKVSGSSSDDLPRVLWADVAALRAHRVEPHDEAGAAVVPVVSCGRVEPGTRVRIVEPRTRVACTPGEVGEIWVDGPCVSRGYWRRPLVNQETFQARVVGEDEGRFLRTGDLGFLRDDELYVVGRLKDLLVIHGANHHPEDIEHTVEVAVPGLQLGAAAAFTVDSGSSETLVLAIEYGGLEGITPERLRDLAIDAVNAEHELPVGDLVLVRRGSLPKTTSGKIRRSACRDAYLFGTLAVAGEERPPRAPAAEATVLPAPVDAGVDAILHWLRDWAARRVDSRLIDERRTIPPHLVLDLGRSGLLGMQVPRKWGGLGLGVLDQMRVTEQLAAIDLTLASFVGVNNGLGVRPVLHHGGTDLHTRLLPGLATGRLLGAFAVTEVGAGSAVHSITATAVPTGPDSWRITGTKIFIGSAAWADVINTFVRLTDERGRPAGMAGFAVPADAPGLRVGAEALTMGLRGMVQSSVHFDGVAVTRADLLGEAGDGMTAARDTMMHARLMIGALSVGAMKRAIQLQLRYATRREVATGRLLDNPVTLLRMSTATAAAGAVEALVHGTAALLDAGGDVPEELFVACKALGPELLWQTVDGAVQTLGGRGYIETNVLPQLLRDARILRVYEGPTEVMLAHLGSSVANGGAAVMRLLTEHCDSADLAAELSLLVTPATAGSRASTADLDPAAVTQLTHHTLGHAAAYTLLVGMLRRAVAADPGLGYALLWAEERRRVACHAARHGQAELTGLVGAAEVTARVDAYAGAIGVPDQHPAGIDDRLDELLSIRDVTPPTVEDEAPAAPPTPDDEQGKYHTWLVDWVSTYAGVPSDTIDPALPFLRYGLDSIALLTLSADLEQRFSVSLAGGLFWDFPTIRDLTGELMARFEGS